LEVVPLNRFSSAHHCDRDGIHGARFDGLIVGVAGGLVQPGVGLEVLIHLTAEEGGIYQPSRTCSGKIRDEQTTNLLARRNEVNVLVASEEDVASHCSFGRAMAVLDPQ